MKEPFASLPEGAREALRECGQPAWCKPMLAKLTDEPFSDEEWIFERKLDGERCLAFREGSDLRLMSRNEESLNDTYPELADELAGQPQTSFIVDGEVVAFRRNVTSFERLQGRMQISDAQKARQSAVAVYYYVFDLLYLDPYDVTQVGLRHRKALLKKAFEFGGHIRYTPHRNGSGEEFFREACGKGWEGLIAKRADSAYLHNRSGKWLKFKCVHQQELVIGGYTDPEGSRIGFGALMVGHYDGDDLVYAGKVGTGYDDDTLRSLSDRLSSLERKTPPFDRGDPPSKGAHWVTPKLVAEVAFTEWTDDGKLRHPRYLGLRRDKDPEDVVRERPES